jgi:hypothetical protein
MGGHAKPLHATLALSWFEIRNPNAEIRKKSEIRSSNLQDPA